MTRINGAGNEPKSTQGNNKTPQSPEYQKKQQEYKSKIKPQAQNLDDLKNAAHWKQKQIDLAKEYGDTETARVLQSELDRINHDISMSSSVWGK